MNRKKLSELNSKELKKQHTAVKTLTWMLAMVLVGCLFFFIYMSIPNGFTPLIAVPFALSPIVFLNVQTLKKINTELESRK